MSANFYFLSLPEVMFFSQRELIFYKPTKFNCLFKKRTKENKLKQKIDKISKFANTISLDEDVLEDIAMLIAFSCSNRVVRRIFVKRPSVKLR